MSLPDDYEIIKVSSTDATVKIYVPWIFDGVDELYVWYQNVVTGVTFYSELGDFTVTSDSDGGGVFILVENTQVQSIDVSVSRTTPKTQTYNLNNTEALNPVALIEALDKSIKLIQEISLGYDEQAITSINPFAIPDKVTRAGKIQAFDEQGDPTYTTVDEALQVPVDWATEWATKPEDVLISASAGGNQVDDYSALHHAAKSSVSESNASTSETNAATSETNAETAKTNAETSETNAATSETNSLASENKASDWAQEDEDVPVETGPDQFSAKHWAAKAAVLSFPVAIYEDQKAAGVGGGTTLAGDNTRILNTEVSDIANLGTLSANSVVLISGTYEVTAECSAYEVNGHRLKLYDGTTDVIRGVTTDANSGNNVGNTASLEGLIVADGVKAYSLRHYTETARANGLGLAPAAGSNVYCRLTFRKIG